MRTSLILLVLVISGCTSPSAHAVPYGGSDLKTRETPPEQCPIDEREVRRTCLVESLAHLSSQSGGVVALTRMNAMIARGDFGPFGCPPFAYAIGYGAWLYAGRPSSDNAAAVRSAMPPVEEPCSDGYINGLVAYALRGGDPQDLPEFAATLCGAMIAIPQRQRECFRGAGHLLAARNATTPLLALAGCEGIKDPYKQGPTQCVVGALMEGLIGPDRDIAGPWALGSPETNLCPLFREWSSICFDSLGVLALHQALDGPANARDVCMRAASGRLDCVAGYAGQILSDPGGPPAWAEVCRSDAGASWTCAAAIGMAVMRVQHIGPSEALEQCLQFDNLSAACSWGVGYSSRESSDLAKDFSLIAWFEAGRAGLPGPNGWPADEMGRSSDPH